MYDIIIIGSGPAGSIFASLLDNKYKTLLISANKIKEKPCGGLLSPDAQVSLAKLNLSMPKSILVDPQIFSVKVIDNDSKITKNYERHYINFNRKKFDDWLLSLVGKHIDIINGFVTKLELSENNYQVKVISNGQINTYKAKYIIGADGSSSLTRTFLYPNSKTTKYLSIQEWYKTNISKPIYSCIFDREVTSSYSWTLVKDGYLIYGGAYTSRKEFEKGSSKITNSTPIKREACLITHVKKLSDLKTGYNNAFLLGEAAGFISPSSYEGISYAINSGILLSEVFNKYSTNLNKIYNRKTLKLKIKILTKIIKSKILQNKLLRKLIMKSGISSIKIVNEKND